jgi:DNA topoisomerase-1
MNVDDKDNAIASAEQAGLYYSSNSELGYTRQIKEEEPIFLDTNGKQLKGKRELKRIEDMRIPPAWTDVWICEEKNGHLQATGIDAKKRTQYIYHSIWTQLRSEAKFAEMVSFGKVLPKIRDQYFEDLAYDGNEKQNDLPYERVMALIARLLDTTFIRIGNETSRDDKEKPTYGLSTMQDDHIEFGSTEITEEADKWYDGQIRVELTFVGKSSKKHKIVVDDNEFPDLAAIAMWCKEKGQNKEGDVFIFFDENGNEQDVKAYHINEYIQDSCGEKYTAKDCSKFGPPPRSEIFGSVFFSRNFLQIFIDMVCLNIVCISILIKVQE